jgi:hypothetical protein
LPAAVAAVQYQAAAAEQAATVLAFLENLQVVVLVPNPYLLLL